MNRLSVREKHDPKVSPPISGVRGGALLGVVDDGVRLVLHGQVEQAHGVFAGAVRLLGCSRTGYINANFGFPEPSQDKNRPPEFAGPGRDN
jgi:hypothetical protein